MRRTAFIVIAQILFLVVSHAQSGKSGPDLSGRWKMDPARSESAHQAVPIGEVVLFIRQTPTEISIETQASEAGKQDVHSEVVSYKLDGTETVTEVEGKSSVKSKAHWDGVRLITETERNINGSSVTTHYVHLLSGNGKELTVEKTLTVQHGYQFEGSKSFGTGTDVFVKTAGR